MAAWLSGRVGGAATAPTTPVVTAPTAADRLCAAQTKRARLPRARSGAAVASEGGIGRAGPASAALPGRGQPAVEAPRNVGGATGAAVAAGQADAHIMQRATTNYNNARRPPSKARGAHHKHCVTTPHTRGDSLSCADVAAPRKRKASAPAEAGLPVGEPARQARRGQGGEMVRRRKRRDARRAGGNSTRPGA